MVLSLWRAVPGEASLVPEFYESVLLGFAQLTFRLRGFKRVTRLHGAVDLVQKWHWEKP